MKMGEVVLGVLAWSLSIVLASGRVRGTLENQAPYVADMQASPLPTV